MCSSVVIPTTPARGPGRLGRIRSSRVARAEARWHILRSQLAGVIALIAVLRFSSTFNAFDEIYLLSGGGAEVLATHVYTLLTVRNDVPGSAAVAMFMAAILAVRLVVYLKFFGERERA
jgi:multiple sugar transport system permease protein